MAKRFSLTPAALAGRRCGQQAGLALASAGAFPPTSAPCQWLPEAPRLCALRAGQSGVAPICPEELGGSKTTHFF